MMAPVARLLASEVALFALASLVHAGALGDGHRHAPAATAEGVIAAILLAGLVGYLLIPTRAHQAALTAQVAALLGTLIGLFTIIIGVGPQTGADYVFHAVLLLVLPAGLAYTASDRAEHMDTP